MCYGFSEAIANAHRYENTCCTITKNELVENKVYSQKYARY